MRRLAWLVVCLLALLTLASMCGSSPRRGYSPVYGDRYSRVKGYAPGQGGAATWDTVVVVFSTEARSAVAGVDTFPRATGTPVGNDVVRIRRLNDWVRGRNNRSWRDSGTDTAIVYRLGTGQTVSTFAWGNIGHATADTFGYSHAAGDRVEIYCNSSPTIPHMGANLTLLNMSYPGTSRKTGMFYIPFENYIPANSTIVSATLNVSLADNAYLSAATDTIIAQPMHANWNKWWLVKGAGAATNQAHASWSMQEDTKSGAWTGSRQYPWVPDLDYLPKFWDINPISDWSAPDTLVTGGNAVPAKRGLDIDITNSVQYFVNGNTNTGIMYNVSDLAEAVIQHYRWDTGTNPAGRTPYVVVKYITKAYQKPFGTSDWAFVFETDDWRAIANKAYADTMEARGGKMTMFGAKTQIGTVGVNDATRGLSVAELIDLHDAGHEMGSHSKFHTPAKGYHDRIVAGGGIASAAYDSMVVDYGPNWMYAVADSGGRNLRSSPRWAKSFGAPVSELEAYAQRALTDHGWWAWRTLSTYLTYDREKYYTLPRAGYRASADSSMTGAVTQYGRHVRNIKEQVPWDDCQRLVGPVDSTSTSLTHLPKVAKAMKRAVFQRRGNNTRVVYVFRHDLKSGGSGAYPTEGINADELGRLCYVTNLLGGRYMTAAELGQWYEDNSTPIDYPFANGRPDTFQIYATDRVWAKPDGVDNRFIPGLRQPTIAANFDNTTPAAPTGLIAYGQDGSCILTWTASTAVEPVSYRVYRYYDGSPDTTLVGTTNSVYFVDSNVTNGSPHNYFVTSRDAAGNESADSVHDAATPGTILTSIDNPAYFGFWYQDAADSTPLSDSDVAKLAAYDAVVIGPHPLELNDETGYDGLLARVRAQNPDAIMLTYFDGFMAPSAWATYPAGSAGRRVWNYCVSLPDSGGFAEKITAGTTVGGDVYDVKFYNVMNTTLADTIASILCDVYSHTGVNGEYAGFFIDDVDTTLADWPCNAGNCDDLIDYDQDGTAYGSDADEKAAVKAWHIDFARALRREFAQRGWDNRLLVPNSTWGRKDDPSPNDDTYMALIDGFLNEGWNRYWPGHATETDTGIWSLALGMVSQLVNTQTNPPLVLWNARADSSDQYMNEVLAMAHTGFVGSNDDDDWHGSNSVPTMGRRIAALEPGLYSTPTFGETDGSSPDTLKIVRGTLTGRMILGRNASQPDSLGAVWPYVIFNATGDTLSRSVYWERAGEEGAPQQPGFQTLQGDNMITVIMERCLGCTEDMADSDVRLFKIVSTADEGDGPVERTYYVSPDTLGQWDSDEESFAWRDYTVQNGFEYCYSVSVIDYLGNESPVFSPSGQCRTPVDNEAPPAVDAIVASGTEGAVEVAWTYSAAPNDFDYYRITRRIAGSGAAFAALDSVSVVAYTDDSAVGGISYNYNVRAVDDDGNVGELPETWGTGGWYGTVDPTYPAPSNVRALADNPSGYTSVVIYPPSDQTGLTSYSVYRGRYAGGAAATDTTACTLYKTGLTPDGFGGHVFVDLHATNGAATDTAFQYTARALYSGNASEKYAVPAWALSTGGFSAQTPGCFAFGNGTNISVACMTLSGSDSTRIFRGTSAGTQSYVTTVAVANNPWTDTTALANTDYWYKLRQVDDGVVSQFSAVSGPARWTSSTGPAVTDSGDAGTTLQHGESITITGPNLGTKRPNGVGVGPPIMYDSFDNGVNGQRLTTTPRWRSYQNWDSPYGAIFADQTWYPQAVPYGNRGKCLYGAMVNGVPTDAMAYNLDFAATDTLYYSYNYRLNFWDSRLATPAYNMATSFGVIKLGRSNRVGEDYAGRGEMSFSDNDIIWNDGAGGDHSNNAAVAESHKYYAIANPSSWKRMEMFRAIPNLPATTDQYGPIWWRRNGQFIPIQSSYHPEWPNSNLGNQMLRAAGQTWRIGTILLPFGWANMWQGCSTCRGEMYCDDVYVDNTQMRVEIGNNSTFNSCTERNIQIPVTWTPTSITATVNTGAFADGSYYLFVLGEDGQPVATVPIVIDNP